MDNDWTSKTSEKVQGKIKQFTFLNWRFDWEGDTNRANVSTKFKAKVVSIFVAYKNKFYGVIFVDFLLPEFIHNIFNEMNIDAVALAMMQLTGLN